MSKKKHHTRVFTTAGNQELGKDIMRLRYDKTVSVLAGMRSEAERQQIGDDRLGHPKLAAALRRLRDALNLAVEEAQEVAAICKPFNDKEN